MKPTTPTMPWLPDYAYDRFKELLGPEYKARVVSEMTTHPCWMFRYEPHHWTTPPSQEHLDEVVRVVLAELAS